MDQSIDIGKPAAVPIIRRPKPTYMLIVGGLVGAAVVAVVSFSAGAAYQQAHGTATVASNGQSQNSLTQGPGGIRARRGGIGSVTAISTSSITVQNARTGTSKTFTIDSSTRITKDGATIAATDIQVGDMVLIRTTNASATKASAIVVSPNLGMPSGASAGSAPTPAQST